jgi:hypothetical protein
MHGKVAFANCKMKTKHKRTSTNWAKKNLAMQMEIKVKTLP